MATPAAATTEAPIIHGGEEEDGLGSLPEGWEKRVRPDGERNQLQIL